jgi:hypothetical protein
MDFSRLTQRIKKYQPDEEKWEGNGKMVSKTGKTNKSYDKIGLVVRAPCYRSWGPGFDSRHYQIFWDGVHSASWR